VKNIILAATLIIMAATATMKDANAHNMPDSVKENKIKEIFEQNESDDLDGAIVTKVEMGIYYGVDLFRLDPAYDNDSVDVHIEIANEQDIVTCRVSTHENMSKGVRTRPDIYRYKLYLFDCEGLNGAEYYVKQSMSGEYWSEKKAY
jgi:hypothetical protein